MEAAGVRYSFAPLTHADLPLLAAWRARPHVRRWWGDPADEPEELEKLADPRIAMSIVSLDGSPFAFVQDYDVHGWSPHPFSHLPPGSRGIDLYIGEEHMIGAGHGTAFVRQLLDRLFAGGCPAVGADPHPENLRAQRAFRKAGFVQTSGPVETPWGRAVLMECVRPK